MPPTTPATNAIWRLTRLVAILAVLAGALVVGIVAISISRSTGSCVNTVLGDRAPSTARDAAAHVAYANAQKKFAAGIKILAGDMAERPGDPATAERLAKVADAFVDATSTYQHELIESQNYRASHPLGRC